MWAWRLSGQTHSLYPECDVSIQSPCSIPSSSCDKSLAHRLLYVECFVSSNQIPSLISLPTNYKAVCAVFIHIYSISRYGRAPGLCLVSCWLLEIHSQPVLSPGVKEPTLPWGEASVSQRGEAGEEVPELSSGCLRVCLGASGKSSQRRRRLGVVWGLRDG